MSKEREYRYRSFIDLKHKPKDTEVVIQYKITPSKGFTLMDVASTVAGESSVGTWTDVKTMNERVRKALSPKVYWVDKKAKRARISYPLKLFELGNLPEILNSGSSVVEIISQTPLFKFLHTAYGGAP